MITISTTMQVFEFKFKLLAYYVEHISAVGHRG